MSIEGIAQKASINPIHLGNDNFLIRKKDAGNFIDACKREQKVILGIDTFHKVGNNIIPDMDLIADFSSLLTNPWERALELSVKEAKSFIDKVDMDGLLDFKISSIEDY